ncbi:CHAT domain-containing protein [Haloactinomyces albus]|uniref:Tetratricopeptide (TPR) repeat protein n=1 Tax=Haloactinomyces albus TaxID=1352928 RepID=A0AAE3ZFJ2_9ACTN|nr:CHAT domain-containing protein [Haloactinomyces albus]MDR7302317.1 tetratricopeptide (TPR) repeat protein [Haloactinomyces albus]
MSTGVAVAELSRLLHRPRRGGRQHRVAQVLLGRGLAQLHGNRFGDADADLRAAERLFAVDGRSGSAAVCLHNRGLVALRSGDLPQALRLFTRAVADGLDLDASPEARADRAEALAAAGLRTEARTEMEFAAARLTDLGRDFRAAETRLALADCALRDGDAEGALAAARAARRVLHGRCHPAWSALAVATEWRAKLAAGHRSRYALGSARKAAAACAAHGWASTATELWLAAGIVAKRHDMPVMARKLLGQAASCREAEVAPAPQRVLGWLAEAVLAEQDGHGHRVFEACDHGLRLVEEHAAAMPAFDLRVHAFGLAGELAETAIGAALRTADPELVLRWSERYRAGALHRRDLPPPEEPGLSAALEELRAAVAEMRTGRLHAHAARVAVLEDRVRDQAMLADGTAGGVGPSCGLDDIRRESAGAVLVSYFVHDGVLRSVSLVDGELRTAAHGSEDAVGADVDRLRWCLGRQAARTHSPVAAAFAEGARHAAEGLERQLLAPVLPELRRGRALVIVPTGRLHALPWAALPGCRGRSVTVAPSLRCWLRAAEEARSGARSRRQVWVAGPGLEHAGREARTLRAMSGGELLTGGNATAERVLGAMDGARIVHIAAHGWFRDDRPLLSCLDLFDGPLYGYDLDRLRRGPTTVVLSACEGGRSAVGRGDELRGLAAALLGRGTATVIASIVPVPDERTAEVMVSLHSALRENLAPAEALARAQARHGESGFICLGYGGGYGEGGDGLTEAAVSAACATG